MLSAPPDGYILESLQGDKVCASLEQLANGIRLKADKKFLVKVPALVRLGERGENFEKLLDCMHLHIHLD